MSIVRLVIAWLIMAALPLQGFAASTMLFCEQAEHSTTSQAAGHDHAVHGHGSDHDHVSQFQDGHVAGAADQGAKLTQQQPDNAQGSGIDDGHACAICASCCNLVALSETPTLSLGGASPMAPPLQGPSRVITRDAPAPDKPPRA